MKLVPLPKGQFAMVDDEDFERVMTHSWHINSYGYAIRREYVPIRKKKVVAMHRFIMNAIKGDYFDHRDRNPLNNQKENLRRCSHRDNMRNKVKQRGNFVSPFKGVEKWGKTGLWRAKITKDEVRFELGRYAYEADAAIAYNIAAVRLHGEFANLNVIDGTGFPV